MQGLVGRDDIFGLLPLESFEQKSDLIRLKSLKSDPRGVLCGE